jgi:hypothetical protein
MICTFNNRLFDNFISKSKTIKPQLSDDWEFFTETFNQKSGVTLKSKKLNMEVVGIPFSSFLDAVKEYEINISNGRFLEGLFIIGRDRKIYSKEYYNEWLKKYNDIKGTKKVTARNLILGQKYVFKCGAEQYLIGIDRDNENKPIYIFGEIIKNEKGQIKNLLVNTFYNNLKEVSREAEENIKNIESYEKYYNLMMSRYLVLAYDTELKRSSKLLKIYDSKKGIISKEFFEIKNDRAYDLGYVYKCPRFICGSVCQHLHSLRTIFTNFYNRGVCEVDNFLIKYNKITWKDLSIDINLEIYEIDDKNLPKNVSIVKF